MKDCKLLKYAIAVNVSGFSIQLIKANVRINSQKSHEAFIRIWKQYLKSTNHPVILNQLKYALLMLAGFQYN